MHFAISIFLSAFLLFQIQPMIGKYILPWFGGTPSVWSTSMLFFQVLLTGGYAYSYWLVGRFSNRRQGSIHLILLCISLILLGVNSANWISPILPGVNWRPQDVSQPITDVLKILLIAVGLSYFLLSTNSSLMQTWFNRQFPGRSPYWLYALSNVGSIIGLISYPILFEPMFSLTAQSRFWTAGYILFIILAGYSAWGIFRSSKNAQSIHSDDAIKDRYSRPAKKKLVLWVVLAAIASIMLLSTTSRLTQEVAVIPFLWVLPLTIYLTSFILTFSGERWYNRKIFIILLFISTTAYLWSILSKDVDFVLQIVVYSVLLFATTMICHGELFRSRPDPAYLTSFYLMVSIGGAVGGIAVSLVAPFIFSGYWEFQIGLIATWILVLAIVLQNSQRVEMRPSKRVTLFWVISLGTLTSLLVGFLYLQVQSVFQESLVAVRNFYGVLRVLEYEPDVPNQHRYALVHGATVHGIQFLSLEKRSLPTTYYTEDSGFGRTILNHPSRPGPLKVGILGLGIGVQGAYGQPGDIFRFYEINPEVVEILDGSYFSYVKDTPANVEIILGDARTSLEKELSQSQVQNYDLFVIDAFSSDSIPVHLLTREAFEIYLQHLKTDGILAFHISNRNLNLQPVVWQLADEFGLDGLFFENHPTDSRSFLSWWIVLTNNQTFLQNPEISQYGDPHPTDMADTRLWTDDYNNLFQFLK